MTISSFTDENRFLSNFWTEPQRGNRSVEHFYQAAKAAVPAQAAEILADSVTAGQSKRLGQKVELRDDWNQIKDDVMYQNVRSKFMLDKELADKLLATGDQELIEGNNWGDRYWGAEWVPEVEEWVGENKLGKILMEVRTQVAKARELGMI